jgi:hypothetical protein
LLLTARACDRYVDINPFLQDTAFELHQAYDAENRNTAVASSSPADSFKLFDAPTAELPMLPKQDC